MKVDEHMYEIGADVFYSKEFRDTLESHMDYFRKSRDTRAMDVDPQKAEVYDGDLFGFLLYAKIAPKLHWVVMRVNNFFSPTEFGPGVTSLLIPKTGDIESLRQSQKSSGTGTITL